MIQFVFSPEMQKSGAGAGDFTALSPDLAMFSVFFLKNAVKSSVIWKKYD